MFQTQGIEGRRGACGRQRRIFHTRKQGICASRTNQDRHEHAADRLARRRRPGRARRAAAVGRRREPEGRTAQPQGRADRVRRPDQPGQRPGDLHQAARRGQGRPADRALRHRADRADHADGEAARAAPDGQLLVPGEREGAARHVVQQLAVERRLELVRRLHQGRAEGGREDGRDPRGGPGVRAEPGERRARAGQEGNIKSVYDQNYPRPPPTSPRSSAASARRGRRWCSSCPTRTTRWRSSAR